MNPDEDAEAIHRTAHLGALQIDVSLVDLGLRSIEGGLRLGGAAGVLLLLLRCGGQIGPRRSKTETALRQIHVGERERAIRQTLCSPRFRSKGE